VVLDLVMDLWKEKYKLNFIEITLNFLVVWKGAGISLAQNETA
jgi:hypothetical protein